VIRRLLVAGVILAALLAAAVLVLLPARAAPAAAHTLALTWPVARGAYHVHSRRSDGTGTLDEIAAAASRAGLQFVIVTDHGDGTRVPEPPTYRSGVLCLDGVEISTRDGHYVAIALPATPYPLGGHPRDVIEDVRRFRGFGIAAHPGSPKAELRWSDWGAPFDGLEWLNADSEWRDEFWGSLGAVLLTYAFRPVETLGGLLDRPEEVIRRWDELTRVRRIPALAGADAHARLGWGQGSDPYEDRVLARVPAYEVSFHAFVNHVVLDSPLEGDAAADGERLLSAIRNGRVFTSIDSLAAVAAFELKATSGGAVARVGEYLEVRGPVAIEAAIGAPEGTTLTLRRDGQVIYEQAAAAIRVDVGGEPGAYRVEARLPWQTGGSAVPWVLTNPIYVGLRDAHERAATPPPAPAATARAAIATEAWQPEASDGSSSTLRVTSLQDGTPALAWDFALAGGAKQAQFAAIRFPLGAGFAAHDRLQLRAQSDAPRRIWAQLRAPGARGGERWGKSFYVAESLEAVELRFEEFRPLGPAGAERPPMDRVDSLLLVVDTVNTKPGTAGRIAITDLWLAR
jgi:hypothetical protein